MKVRIKRKAEKEILNTCWRFLAFLSVGALFLAMFSLQFSFQRPLYASEKGVTVPSSGHWLKVEIGIIGPASEDILDAAMNEVATGNYAGLLVILDTPGGSLESTRKMVKSIMAFSTPVVVWVGPSGSRAGSAGAFITLSAHIAAMAPGTNIGAAHPVEADGKNIGGGEKSDGKDDIKKKVLNDTVAFIESIAKTRDRNVEMARSFVVTSVSITDEEALQHKVIDVVAKDVDSLFQEIDGKTIKMHSGESVTLATAGAESKMFEKSFRQQLLEILSNPNLFYLLFMAGLIGIGFELTHPGVIFPGVAGVICMILALIATSVLPISYGAAALILVGVGLMIAEIFLASFGVMGIGGLIAFLLGSIFLVDPSNEQGLRISWYAIAPGVFAIGFAILAIGCLVLRSTRSKVATGKESLLSAVGEVIEDFTDGRGNIRINGEIWSAEVKSHISSASDDASSYSILQLKTGEKVRIVSVEGLKLWVERLSNQ